MKRALILFLFAWSFVVSCVGYTQSSAALTSDGRDFYIGHMPSSNRCTNTTKYMGVWALITSQFGAAVTVSYFDDAGVEQPGTTYSLQANSSKRIKLTTQAMELNDKKGEGDGEYKACHIKANAPIAVQYYTTGPNSCGMYSAIPTSALGKEYVVQAWHSNPGYGIGVSSYACPRDSSSSEFMIIAAFDGTKVEIHNTGLTMKGIKGSCYGKDATGKPDASFSVTLKRGQCYMVKSTYYDDQNSMDGTYIKADKPVAVLAAQENALNGKPDINNILFEDVRDLMVEQMIPVEYWSDKDYFSMPLRDSGPRNNNDKNLGEIYRVYAMGDDNLTFNIDKQGPREMQVGQFCKYAQQSNVETGVNIRSQNGTKIGVAMFDYRQQNQNQPFPAPSQMTIIPASSWKKFYSWMVPDDQIIAVRNFFVNIITNKDSLTQGKVLISVNGGPGRSANSFPAAGGYEQIPGHPELIGKRIVVGPGSYSLYGNTPCAVYHYGMEAFDLDGDLGDNEGDDFYFGYASPVGQSFGKPGGGTPSVSHTFECSSWDVTISDILSIDDGLASVELLNDPDGVILGKPYVTSNLDLIPLSGEIVPTSTSTKVRLQVRNPFEKAFGYLYVVNRAGKDTLVTFVYNAPTLQLTNNGSGKSDSLSFAPLRVGDSICGSFKIVNNSTTQDTFTVKSISEIGPDKDITVSGTVPTIPAEGLLLKTGDSLIINVCYKASDTGTAHLENISLNIDCYNATLKVRGSGITPLIRATDYTFPEILVGDTICKTVKITNVGNSTLTIDKDFQLGNIKEFTVDATPLPRTLKPNQSIDITVCYHPINAGSDTTTVTWKNDLPIQFQGSIKDYSILKGSGVKRLHWDRALQRDTVPINFTKLTRVFLVNTAFITHIDSIVIHGPDASEYKIANNQTGYDPPINIIMGGRDSIWVDILFTPDVSRHSNPLATRTMSLLAYAQSDIAEKIDFETHILPPSLVKESLSANTFSIHPNPSSDGNMMLSYSSIQNGWITVSIIDLLGREVQHHKHSVTIGANTIPLSLRELRPGSYFVQVNDNGVLYKEKIVIH